jgi:IMP dehydrogenase
MAHYSDVYILPQYSEITSRSIVDTSSVLDPKHTKTEIPVPVISANMDTVTDGYMAKEINKAGGLGAIHRFYPNIDENVAEFKKTEGQTALVSVGVNDLSKKRAAALYGAGARHFVIDIAHGDHVLMKDMISWMKTSLENVFVIAGNVAQPQSVENLIKWGADGIKVGIGPGAACTTKNVTGVTVPQFLAVAQCASTARSIDKDVVVIADGGVTEIGDIAKALGAGADFVMCGKMFASCPEAPHPGLYRGMASLDAMRTVRAGDKLPTPEGRTLAINEGSHVAEVIDLIGGGLRSAFSYSNARNLKEFQSNCKFGFK